LRRLSEPGMVRARSGALIEWFLEKPCEIKPDQLERETSVRVAVSRISHVTGIGYDGTRKREIVFHYLSWVATRK
jgi:hypothetical protein